MSTVLLSGGTGGAKLARGLYELIGEELTVIANTGDDIEIYGAHVSPDPDLVTYWLADRIDERGWGIKDDTFTVMEALRELGREIWFNLGDRDLAVCIERQRLLAASQTLTTALARLGGALGLSARVLPMSDQPVRTRIQSGGAWIGLQEFLIRLRGSGPIEAVEFVGAGTAQPTPQVLAAIANATTIIIGPSNPVISIGPILELTGMREALREAPAPVVAVSPIVGGSVLKGPTAACMSWAGESADAGGVVRYYGDLLDGLVSDEFCHALPTLRTATLMDALHAQVQLARHVLDFAQTL